MHARRRGAGDGFRSNSVGNGLTSGRISPEGSIRAHRMYNSEYRNLNRGFGRALLKPYPPPQPPPPPLPRRGDVFMEAGRLAAEYLVSKGLLPPNSLPGKWQNGNLKGNLVGNFQELRVQARENYSLSSESRNSGFSRVGNVPDGGSARRKFSEDFNSIGYKNHLRGRKRMAPFRAFSSDRVRENGRKGPWLEKTRPFSDVEGGDDFAGVTYQGEQNVGSSVGGKTSKVVSGELPLKSELAGESGSELENMEFPDDAGSKASSSGTKKDILPEIGEDSSKGPDDANTLNSDNKEVNNGTSDDKIDDENAPEDVEKEHCLVEDEPINKLGGSLLRLCSFAKVPTKPRSSLALRVTRVDRGPSTEARSACDIAPASGLQVPMEEDSGEVSTHSSKSLVSDISIAPFQPLNEPVDMGVTFVGEREICTGSQSFSDGSTFIHEEELSDAPPGFEKCISVALSNKGDNFADHAAIGETNKGPRESPSSGVLQGDEDNGLHNSRAEHSCLEVEKLSPDEKIVESGDQKMLLEDGLVPKDGAESNIEAREEQQLLPCSFKICDLNLMVASEIAESPDALIQDHVSTAPSTMEVEEAPKSIGLSTSNSLSDFDDYHRLIGNGKDIMGVDSANGSLVEDKEFVTSGQKTETMYSCVENFLNHPENADLPDVQDGYDNAISELLGTVDIPNCSAVPTDIDELQSQIPLHGQEEILVDDDPIYLSLGEIPLSMSGFLGFLDHPTQDYGRPF